MRRFFPLAIIGAIFLLAIGGGLMLWRKKEQQQPSQTSPLIPIVETTPAVSPTPEQAEATTPSEKPSSTEVPAVASVPEELHIRGGAKAPVTLEEYGDFQCQPCGRFYPVLKKAEADYGDRLRVVFRHMPLRKHEHARLAARASEAAGLQGHFWEMHDVLFENSARWTKGVDTVGPEATPSRRLQSEVLAMDIEVRDVLYRYAEILKLDVERFKRDLDSDVVKERVESDRSRGAGLGIDRTPTIYVNGQHLTGNSFLTAEGLHGAIESVLAGKAIPSPAPSPSSTPQPSK